MTSQGTEWCSGMVVVPKSQGIVQICVELTKLNRSVCHKHHILPLVDQSLTQISGAKVFSANSGFWRIELSKESTLPLSQTFGRCCFNQLPFGITSTPEHFLMCMSEIDTDLDGVVCQMDDILVFGKSYHEHDQRLKAD